MALVPDATDLLAPLTAAPERSALLLDVDGTLAPIVARPELAAVPEATKLELRRLVGRYALVAAVSGRSGEDAARLVGIPGIQVVGNHGLELDPRAEELAGELARFRDSVGLPVEDKRLSLSYHYREAPDPDAARAALEDVARRAEKAGLVPRWGRMVLEIRPPVDADKGVAVRTLLARSRASRALYAGDDTTDLDAFVGLREAGLERAVCVAVASDEGPAELRNAADLVVADPEAMAELLAHL
jgi:trehalose 6-phosphate phosphatase